MTLNIWEIISKWSEQLKTWLFDNYENPGLWLFLFAILLVLVMVGYNYLHRK